MKKVFLWSVLLMWAAAHEQPAPPRAEKIFLHANVYTGVADTSAFKSIRRAQAVAVRGDRIQAVGENAEILKLKGPETQVIDLGGKFLMPGFNDAHVHLSEGGSNALNVNLVGVKSLDQFRERQTDSVLQNPDCLSRDDPFAQAPVGTGPFQFARVGP